MFEYTWTAKFKDGSELSQFSESREVNFKEVLNREDELTLFTLHRQSTTYPYLAVDLRSGFITIFLGEGLFLPIAPFHRELDLRIVPSVKYRLIWFRRRKSTIGMRGDESWRESESAVFCVGWQTTLQGHNIKRIVTIDEEGRIGIG